jgi:copper(I)-binding protein
VIRSSHGRKVLRRLLVGAAALLVPVLAGCEAGDNAPVLQFHPAANGAYATADSVSVDNAFILGGPDNTPLTPGSSASMFLAVYNAGNSADKLVSASAPGSATSVQLAGGSIAVPAQAAAYLTGPQPKVVLRGLTSALPSGGTITVILTFQNAGAMTLSVPVIPRVGYYTTLSPPAPSISPSKRVTPGATGSATATPGTATPTPGVPAQPSVSPSATP